MSLTVYTIRAIRCDKPRCEGEFEGRAGDSAKEVREASWRAGWSYIGREDLCPKHKRYVA